MHITVPVFTVLLVASFDLITGGIILSQNPRNRINFSYAFFALTVALWGFGVGFYSLAVGPFWSNFLARFLYFAGGSIPASFLYFSIIFNEKKPVSFKILFLIFLPTLLFIPLYFMSNAIIAGYSTTGWFKGFDYGNLHYLFDVHLWAYFAIAFIVLIRKYLHSTGTSRQQTLFVIFGTYVVLAIAGATNVVAPLLSIFDLIWVGPAATILWIGVVAYAVTEHQLFNIRVIATESLVVSLWLLFLVRVFVSANTFDLWINSTFFITLLILGIFLIRAVIKEVEQREKIEKQEKELEESNARLRELDVQKSEFLSFASHQLRTPLTAIKWGAGALLDRTYGDVPANLQEPIRSIFDQSSAMAVLVDDYLNVSRIEQGRMQYQFAPVDLGAVVKTVAAQMGPSIQTKGLALVTDIGEDRVMVWGDTGKLIQVFSNIVDNAIKYTPQGTIHILLRKMSERGVAHVEIRDTGIGMDEATRLKIFEKFARGSNAQEVNSGGSGLGLFIVKTFVEAHKGKIWPESQGIGKGTVFYIELPLLIQK